MASRRSRIVPPALMALLLAPACTWGNANGAGGESDAGVGAHCDGVLATCRGDLACVSGHCRKACAGDSSCPTGLRCLVVSPSVDAGSRADASAPGFCVDNATVGCQSGSFCPRGTSCAYDGRCRDTCNAAGAQDVCPAGELCQTRNAGGSFCFGSPEHEIASDGGAADGGAPPAQTLANSLSAPTKIVADAHGVFWISNTTVGFISYCASNPCLVVENVIMTGATANPAIATSDDVVYWSVTQGASNSVAFCQDTASGCFPSTFGTAGQVTHMAVAGGALAWTANQTVYTCPSMTTCTAGQEMALTPTMGPVLGLTFHPSGKSVYWVTSSGLFECGLPCKTPKGPIAIPGGPAVDLAANATGVFVATPGGVWLSSGPTEVYAAPPSDAIVGVAADADGVYAATALGSIVACPGDCKTSGAAKAIVEGEASPSGIAVSRRYIYWTARGDSVRFVAK